jgi:hypothetical protein
MALFQKVSSPWTLSVTGFVDKSKKKNKSRKNSNNMTRHSYGRVCDVERCHGNARYLSPYEACWFFRFLIVVAAAVVVVVALFVQASQSAR